jgi:DNA polymerase-3 subunit epsilon
MRESDAVDNGPTPTKEDERGTAGVPTLRLDRRGSSRRETTSAPVPALVRDEFDALDGMARTLTASGWYRVVRRFERRDRYGSNPAATVRRALYIDVESTGLDTATDQIIELAAVPFTFDRDGVVYDVGEPLSFFEDPGVPIPSSITELTGIDSEMVRGARIDDDALNAVLAECVLVIAHNAHFDRKLVERRLPAFANVHWACSQREVPWSEFGCAGVKLEYLLYRICGEFHDGHRAVDDCLAGVHLLAEPECEGRTAMSFLLESARQPTMRVWAIGAAFELKDMLKGRQYRWSDGSGGKPRAWYRDVAAKELAAEKEWLIDAAYGGDASRELRVDQFGGKDRYSSRG